ncbi:MAG: NADH-quinone oxidoreductase subunit NuoG [bacterium]|nr:NADH-quinone oxidoreductase subunit NuoG [bacterium]
MANTVTIYIDEKPIAVPAGMNLVQALKEYADTDVPVFCYHPKMKPVGMCRMCLVELGTPLRDRATGEVVMENGQPKIGWNPKLQTACTQVVSDGLRIRTTTDVVAEGRRNIVEFLLTSHPLDCPICDKGGECPLQNLTMAHGPGTSRMNFDDKMHLDKHVPLGDLIYLDEERCIQCGRCVRFQDEVVGDPVLGFHERGRTLQIVTVSDPPFDTYFSGNTTDICPVGALTTSDFRFGARPWELTNVPSICPHCPVGCNTSAATRLDREAGGKAVIKRIMPRQNEAVNEIWMCDKGRFGHHFTRAEDRLIQPMIRRGGGVQSLSNWGEALTAAAQALKGAEGSVAAIAGSGISNEDAYLLRQVVMAAGGERLGAWKPTHAGADLVAQVGVGVGTNLGTMGAGDAILVIASDLEEEAPVWRLRVKQAADRGATVIVANARPTRMDDFATATFRYAVGDAASTFTDANMRGALAGAANLVIIAGAEGLTFDGSRALMQTAAQFLGETGHIGKANNGLMATFPGANMMGLHYAGFSAETTHDIIANPPKVLIVVGADILYDDPTAAAWLSQVETVIALSLFPDDLTRQAAVAMPIQSFAERDGSFTNGERRVQRFYTAHSPMGEALPAWTALARVLERINDARPKASAAAVMLEMTQAIPAFAGSRYTELAKVTKQTPDVGGADLYYGGTAYKNTGGLGVQIASAAETGSALSSGASVNVEATAITVERGQVLVVPTTVLYNREQTFRPSETALMETHVPAPFVEINEADARTLGVNDGERVEVSVGSVTVQVRAHVNGSAPQGVVLLPRNLAETATPLMIGAGTITKVLEAAAVS